MNRRKEDRECPIGGTSDSDIGTAWAVNRKGSISIFASRDSSEAIMWYTPKYEYSI
jgi:hypothetical protein